MASEEQKFRFLKRVYYGVSDNPIDDVNPFQTSQDFGTAAVGDMNWGIDSDARERSKLRFAFNFHKVLASLSVFLPIEDIFSELKDEQTNDQVVTIWVDKADFK